MHLRASLMFLLVVTVGGVIACGGGGSSLESPSILPAARHASGATGTGSSPIKHVIVVIQENRSFDNFFATFPGANGTTTGEAIPMPSPIANACRKAGQPVITQPTSVPLTEVDLTGHGFYKNYIANSDLAHIYKNGYLYECNSSAYQPTASSPCQMNGFDITLTGPNGEGPAATCTYTYQYVNPNAIAPYWDLAQQYVLADNTFQSQGSSSFTAHQDLIAAGTSYDQKTTGSGYTESVIDNPNAFPWGCDSPQGAHTALITTDGLYLQNKGPWPCFPVASSDEYSTLRDLLDAKGVSWKFYGDKIKSSDGSGIWTAFDAIRAVRHGKEWGTNVVFPDTKIFADLKNGHLPSVSWVVPDAFNSDHPAEKSDTGPSWVASVVNAVGKSKDWKSSAVIVLWDDWGGYFDHVPPPFYDGQGGLGFRIPLLIISPYVQAHVEHTQYETTSILRFIEDNWDLGTLGKLDQRATSIGNAFDFTMKPRKFVVIPSKYPLSYFQHQKPSGLLPDSQ